MLSKFFNKEFFRDRPILLLAGLSLVSMLVIVFRVLTTVRESTSKVAVGYTEYGADTFTKAQWYTLYEFAIFAVVTTVIAIFICARLLKIDRSLAFITIILQHIVLIFLFIVSGALLSLTGIAS